jgi:hypothetical protein
MFVMLTCECLLSESMLVYLYIYSLMCLLMCCMFICDSSCSCKKPTCINAHVQERFVCEYMCMHVYVSMYILHVYGCLGFRVCTEPRTTLYVCV